MRIGPALLTLALLIPAGSATAQAAEKVEVKTVKYAGLADIVRQHRGQVVVVDFWAVW